MSIEKDKITCPHCNQPGTWTPANPFRPFCSERCKLIDLGEWANEGHRIPGEPVNDIPSDLDDSEEDK